MNFSGKGANRMFRGPSAVTSPIQPVAFDNPPSLA